MLWQRTCDFEAMRDGRPPLAIYEGDERTRNVLRDIEIMSVVYALMHLQVLCHISVIVICYMSSVGYQRALSEAEGSLGA